MEKNNDPSVSYCPYQIFNIGGNKPVKLLDFIHEIEKNLNRNAAINFCRYRKVMWFQHAQIYLN